MRGCSDAVESSTSLDTTSTSTEPTTSTTSTSTTTTTAPPAAARAQVQSTTTAPPTTAAPRTTTTAPPPPPTTAAPATTTTTAAPATTTTTAPPTTTTAPDDEAADDDTKMDGEYEYGDPRGTQVWLDLAQCESHQRWDLDTGNGYYGGLQFSLGSWQGVGGEGYPHEHPRDTQIEMGRRLQARQGWGAWPHCSRKIGVR